MNVTKYDLAIGIIASILILNLFGFGQTPDEIKTLLPAQAFEREMTGAETHRYKFDLNAGEFFQVRVEQKGVDVALKLLDSDGKTLATMDSPNGKDGPETLSFVSDKAGKFILEISGFDAKAEKGNYTIKREASRSANAADKRRVEVEKAFIAGMTARDAAGQIETSLSKLEEALSGWRELKDVYLAGLTEKQITQIKQLNASIIYDEAIKLKEQNTVESKQESIRKFQQALKIYKEINENKQEMCLFYIGSIFNSLGNKAEALIYFTQELSLIRKSGDKDAEANVLLRIGYLNRDLGEQQKALDYFNQSLFLFKETGNKKGQSDTLNTFGISYIDLGEYTKAIDCLSQALLINRQINDKEREARTLGIIGIVYQYSWENAKAVDYFNQALLLYRKHDDKSNEASILTKIAMVYANISNYEMALDYYKQSLQIHKQLNSKRSEAVTLDKIGLLYANLGDFPKALDFLNQALSMRKTIGDQRGQASTLNNIGSVYADIGKEDEALEYFLKSLPLRKSVGDLLGEAVTLENIGGSYDLLGEHHKALNYLNQALIIYKQIGARQGAASILTSIGLVYKHLGENDKALEYYNNSLVLIRDVGNKRSEATTLHNIMLVWEALKKPRFAIFYGKQSVNIYQEIRRNIKKVDPELQKTYLKSVENTYRYLAYILISTGRIAEAEEVLAMLKEEEFFAYLRRDDKVAGDLKGKISLLPDEKKAFEEYEKYADDITRSAAEFGALEKKKNDLLLGESLTAEDQKQYDALKTKYDAAVVVFDKFLNDLKISFGTNDKRVAVVESDTQGILKRMNEPRTVVISTIAGEDRLNLIVTTSDTQRAHTVEIKAAELNKLVADFREALKNPSVDPRPLGKKLYDVLFPEALQKDLNGIDADTIVWSLDGTLRYVPMASLWDGKQYLVERYTNAVLTLASRDKIKPLENADRTKWLALGVGVSKPYQNFNALPAVPQELCSVVSDPKKKQFCAAFGKSEGVLKGLMLSDDEFTLAGFENNIGKVPVVHIASHFALNTGDESSSYLLLGGGADRRFSLINLKKTRLDRIELLTLSACNTAMTAGANSSGVEIEGFGALAQNQGAKTVLATLWAVADDSTRDLMIEFYRQLETDPKIGKSEALRKAQLKLINGKYKTEDAAKNRGTKIINPAGNVNDLPKYERDENAPFAHPYFWSPFVLTGNWR